ncbi:MAG: DUF5107 domain-containing protein [Terrimesophilobacter sp.]
MSGTSTVRVERRVFSIAELGAQNPLPMVGAPLESPYQISGELPAEIVDGSHYGHPLNLYPYRLQDGYDRARQERQLTTVVLENDLLRAVFLPELGGRLWELVDKTAGKQLLHSPNTIQFANLALRNAWFAGGIEWNIGTRGHSPTTCEPLHAGTTADGRVLRMWEFERMRGVVFQIDAWLPVDSAVLFVAVRLRNPSSEEVPMYWWSNAAVPQNPEVRVVAPAKTAFATNNVNGISRVDPTQEPGEADDAGTVDCTWPSRSPRSRDYFFDLADEQRRWILSADRDGDGLAMLSTSRLRGRKLFVWGHGRGGHRWQEWLSPEDGQYTEIQAGLAQTQFENLRMPAGAEWSWLEAYGNARVDPDVAHGTDWSAAVDHCEERMESLLSESSLQAAHSSIRGLADLPIESVVNLGTGWGALESQRSQTSGDPWIMEDGSPFSAESMTIEHASWVELLEGGTFSGSDSFVSGADWEARLAAQLETDTPHRAAALFHLAVMKHARGDRGGAESDYQRALEVDDIPSTTAAQVHRGLALLAFSNEAIQGGIDHYLAAWKLANAALGDTATSSTLASAILVEAVAAFLNADKPRAALRLLSDAKATGQQGRLRFLYAQALARTGRPGSAAQLLREGIEIPDLREGRNSLASLWADVCPGEQLPREYEFGMG